jgi:transposase
MRPFGSPLQLEARRRNAMQLLDTGLSLNEVARRTGASPSSVVRWRDERDAHGPDALQPKPASGRPPKLSARQKERLTALLARGAMANGYRTELWTTARIAEIVERSFGVHYHRDHIGRLMASLQWSYQKPDTRAMERNEEAIEAWKRQEWPRIKKTPRGWAPISCSPTNRASC